MIKIGTLDLIFASFIACIVLITGFTKSTSILGFRRLLICVIIGIFSYIIYIIYIINANLYNSGYEIYIGNNISHIFFKVFICSLAICIIISMWDYFCHENYIFPEIPLLILIIIEGMFLAISANDLFTIYLAVELQSFALYIMASVRRYAYSSIEAGLRYFILGSVASGCILYGTSLIYIFLGTTDLHNIYILLWLGQFIENGPRITIAIMIALVLILIGILFKLGASPLHYWVPDVYAGVPMIILFLFSILPKFSILIILIRIMSFVLNPLCIIHNFYIIIIPILTFSAILSIIFGSIGALYQNQIKRMLGYSAIANIGFILLGLSTCTQIGVFASFYYYLIYTIALLNIFCILVAVRRHPFNVKLKNIVEFVSISHSNLVLSILLIISLLSLAGIPPLAGSFGKLSVFFALVSNGSNFLALIVVLLSVLTVVYYIRIIRYILFTNYGVYPIVQILSIPELSALLISYTSLLNICFFFFSAPLIIWLQNITNIFLNLFLI